MVIKRGVNFSPFYSWTVQSHPRKVHRLRFGSRDFVVHHVVFETSQDRVLIPHTPDKAIYFAEGSGLG